MFEKVNEEWDLQYLLVLRHLVETCTDFVGDTNDLNDIYDGLSS